MSVDPITVEVIRHKLEAASRDIRRVVERAAYSPILYEVVDFSCGILDPAANLVAETPGLPIFLANLSYSVKAVYDTIGKENLNPGDVIMCNDPYNGGYTHCPDIVVLCPAFHEGEIEGWAAFRGHTVDMGGIYPGGWYSNTTEAFQEGFRLPPVKVWAEGKPRRDIFNLVRSNSRVPDSVLGDIRAMVAGVRTGAARVRGLVEKYGVETTRSAITEILDQGERLSRAAVARIPDGVYEAECVLDGDGNDDQPLTKDVLLKMAITVKGDSLTMDFSGTDPQCNGPMNIPLPSTVSAALCGFKIVTTPETTSNEGFFRPVTIKVPEGTLLNPKEPAATAMWPVPASSIPDMVIKALSPAIPDKTRAGYFGDSMAHFFYGVDPRKGSYYVSAEPDGGGYGGQPARDGESSMFSMTLGDTYNLAVEVAEIRFPFRIEKFELLQDSGGPGRFRGGLGTTRQYRIVGHKAGLTTTTDRVLNTPPWGLFEGRPGKCNITRVFRANGKVEEYRKISNLPLEDGDLVAFEPGGGGGYGPPLERDPEAVLNDVLDGYISLEGAKADYGVVLDPAAKTVDAAATAALRREMGRAGGSPA